MIWRVGDKVGGYTIESQLGQGGMATVYKAYHPQLDRYVAIKVIHPSFVDDTSFTVRFQREAQIVASLEHPHIVPVYDYNEQNKSPYLVMKYIEGRTLKEYVQEKSPTIADIVRVMEYLSSALDYAHQRGVLHRDIKPSNVMMAFEDNIPYLADFGLARIATAGESTMSADMMLGTPHYISPEQARGMKNLDGRTDIYSLGIMLYELLVGHVPFTGNTPFAIIHDHIYRPLPKPSKINPDLPIHVESVLLKALAKQPDQRYERAGEMVVALKQAIEEGQLDSLNENRATLALESISIAREQYERDISQIDEISSVSLSQVDTITDAVNVGLQPTQQSTTPILNRPEAIQSQPQPTIELTGSTSRSRLQKQRMKYWRLSGCGAFLVLTFIAIGILLSISSTMIELFRAIGNNMQTQDTLLLGTIQQDFRELGFRIDDGGSYPQYAVPTLPVTVAEIIIQDNAEDPLAYLLLAKSYWQANDDERAIETVIAGIPYANDLSIYLMNIRQVAFESDRINQAVGYTILALFTSTDNTYPLIRDDGMQFLYEQAKTSELTTLSALLNTIGGTEISNDRASIIARSEFSRFFLSQQLLSQDNIRAANLLMMAFEDDSQEIRSEYQLLQLQILLKQGNREDAQALASDILEDDDETPLWVTEVINQLFGEGNAL